MRSALCVVGIRKLVKAKESTCMQIVKQSIDAHGLCLCECACALPYVSKCFCPFYFFCCRQAGYYTPLLLLFFEVFEEQEKKRTELNTPFDSRPG